MGVGRGAKVRVVIADDDVLLREGLASLLDRSGIDVVGQAGDAAQMLELVDQKRPDLAIVDIRMPPTFKNEGLDAAHLIRRESPGTGILLLSAHVEVEDAVDLLADERGVGYLLKTRVTAVCDLIEVMHRIAEGGSVVDPVVVSELIAANRRNDPLATLTVRERDVLKLMAEGRSNTGIARRLRVAEGTVEKHIQRILIKLNLPEATDDHRRVRAVITFLNTP